MEVVAGAQLDRISYPTIPAKPGDGLFQKLPNAVPRSVRNTSAAIGPTTATMNISR